MSCPTAKTAARICVEGAQYTAPLLQEACPRVAIAACEGACSKGEVARVAANLTAYRLARTSTVRVCLGDALTASSGFDQLLERAPWVVAVEGCPLCCGTQLLRARFPNLTIRPLVATHYYAYDKAKFEIFDLDPGEALAHAGQISPQILKLVAGELTDPPEYLSSCAAG